MAHLDQVGLPVARQIVHHQAKNAGVGTGGEAAGQLALADQLMAAATQAAQQMSPEQLDAIRNMMGNLGPDQLSALMEQAKKLGLG